MQGSARYAGGWRSREVICCLFDLPPNVHPVMQKADNIPCSLREPVDNQMPLHMHVPVALEKLPVVLSTLRIILQCTECFV
jgi:hypothetical protein